MDHHDARTLASRALDDEVGPEHERDLAVHLISCVDCKAFYDTLNRARAAFRRSAPVEVRTELVETALYRATTVLAGEADPGSMRDGDGAETTEVPAVEVGEDTGPMPAVDFDEDEAETSELEIPPPVPPPTPPPGPFDVEAADVEGAGPPPEPVVVQPLDPPVIEAQPTEPVYEETEDTERVRPRVGAWAAAIVVTALVAGLAGFLFVRGPGFFEGPPPELPAAENVRSRIGNTFDDLQSLKATFSVTRLSLYQLRQQDDRLVYSFSNGSVSGRFVFEDGERYREESNSEVAGRQVERVKVVRTPDEVRTLTGEGEGAVLVVEAGPPFGPPDGTLRPGLGVLEPSVGAAVRLLLDARDLQVLEETTHGEREAYRVMFSVPPTEFTRADRIEMLIDTITWFPLQIRRSIDRADARVLGPPEILDDAAIDAAFGDRDRVTTETVALENVVINDVILPGEFVLDLPEGAEVETVNAGWEHFTLAQIEDELPFEPLLPTSLPQGFREQGFAAFGGEPQRWGPEGIYPAPTGILQAMYSDGKSTVVVSQRRQPTGPFEIEESPLSGPGLPLTVRHVVRGGHQLTYAISPEVPPHVFGWIDDVFIMVSGYARQDDLLRIAASLGPPEDDLGPNAGATPGPLGTD